MKLNIIPHFLRDILKVLLIVLRRNDLLDTGPMCGKNLFLQPADGKHVSLERDLAGHRQSFFHWFLPGERGNRRAHRDSGGRPVFGRRAGRHMDVQIMSREKSMKTILPRLKTF